MCSSFGFLLPTNWKKSEVRVVLRGGEGGGGAYPLAPSLKPSLLLLIRNFPKIFKIFGKSLEIFRNYKKISESFLHLLENDRKDIARFTKVILGNSYTVDFFTGENMEIHAKQQNMVIYFTSWHFPFTGKRKLTLTIFPWLPPPPPPLHTEVKLTLGENNLILEFLYLPSLMYKLCLSLWGSSTVSEDAFYLLVLGFPQFYCKASAGILKQLCFTRFLNLTETDIC